MFVGIDLGTSGVKALLMDEMQVVRASAQSSLDVARPAPGWSEQNPADWVSATSAALRALAETEDLSAVRGIGLSGQMHGATLIDEADRVLRPAILWNDTRSHAEAAKLDADPRFRQITGNIVFPGFTAPKIAWVKQHELSVFQNTRRILLPKDYLRLWLTGEHVSEMSDASGTSWLDVQARDWSDDLLSATDIDRSFMPRLVEGSAQSGALRSEIAQEFGLRPGIPVAGGAGDNAASAVGLGVARAGEAFISLGTSGVLFAANNTYAPAPETAVHTFCHALPGHWHQMGVILSAADSLSWLSDVLNTSPTDLISDLEDVSAPGRAMFLPYLGGERTPHNDAKVRGAFVGLEHAADRNAMTRAALEGVAFAFRDSQQAMQVTGTVVERMIAVGGGSQSRHWLRIVATALDTPIAMPEAGDFGAAFGAARLGMIATNGQIDSALSSPAIADVVEPEPALKTAFEDAYARFRALYTALKDLS